MAMTTVDQLQAHASSLERRRRLYTGLGAAIFAILVVLGFIGAEEMNSGGFVQGLEKFFDYPGNIVSETAEAGTGWFERLWIYLPALIETINMAAVATIFGTVFAVFLSFAATRDLQVWPPIIPVARRIMDITRAFPELILALFLIFMLGSSPVPAIIAVAFHTAGALGKLFSEVNENIDRGPLEGMTAAGASWTQRMRWAVLPQVLPNYTSYMLLRFEINIRASAILGFVGAGGIGSELRKAISWANGADIAALFVLLFLTIMVIDQISGHVRRRLVGGMFVGAR
ncbi:MULTISPECIES: phosphonate ABC transporter, permease protein PhnE [Thalassobaculum]|uniref:Phosphonate transport system permease protein n=1 Tax=Thalassobaculum litoreum DSM 18839 TaxID=1123362 RepID=A0A8G2BJL4_9PROT|nr:MULTISPECIES: phosphonate ABC transporter, permease protein PhnE [Thalassobaculum]SDG07982.1 phosphonate transport system permease protein [Thalassobaculum litoreum DSM 18839]